MTSGEPVAKRNPVALPDIAPALVADGLVLRPWELFDADFVLLLAADPETRRWAQSFWGISDLDSARRWITDRREYRTMWVVCDAATGDRAGWVGLSYLEPEEWSMMVSYGSAPQWRRQGVTRRALDAVTAYAFDPAGLGLLRISLEHATGNLGSCAVAAACGYCVEGTLRQRIRLEEGGLADSHAHARLATDPGGPLTAPGAQIEPVEIVAGAYQLCIPNADLDAAAIVAACADPAIMLYNTGPTDLAAARAWCTHRSDWTSGEHASWLVKDTVGTLLGQVSMFRIDPDQRIAQIGYWVAAPARGRGVAAAAVDAAARFGFGALDLHRIELFHAIDNIASCRTAGRAGFAHEGELRQSYRYGDGVFRDEHLHARLSSDNPENLRSL